MDQVKLCHCLREMVTSNSCRMRWNVISRCMGNMQCIISHREKIIILIIKCWWKIFHCTLFWENFRFAKVSSNLYFCHNLWGVPWVLGESWQNELVMQLSGIVFVILRTWRFICGNQTNMQRSPSSGYEMEFLNIKYYLLKLFLLEK